LHRERNNDNRGGRGDGRLSSINLTPTQLNEEVQKYKAKKTGKINQLEIPDSEDD
jgi:stress response protein SCP2